MTKAKDNSTALERLSGMECPKCKHAMKRISWKICAGAHDARFEVEQTVFQCPVDKNFISVEVTTGNPSEFAMDDPFADPLAYEP